MKKKTLMIVDDSLFIYEEMKHMLADSEFEIIAYARDGESALEQYEHTHPDIVTMDIILPGIDGLEASQHILDRFPDAKIIIVSSLAYDDTTEQAEAIGINHVLFKPFSAEELVAALQNFIM